MPAGCDFVCKNKECKNYDTGISFYSYWPIGDIDEIISYLTSINNLKLIDSAGLTTSKSSGRKNAMIPLPNTAKINETGTRFQQWDDENKIVVELEVEKTITKADNVEDIIKAHPDYNPKFKLFNQIIKEGILCPACGVKLQQIRWFS